MHVRNYVLYQPTLVRVSPTPSFLVDSRLRSMVHLQGCAGLGEGPEGVAGGGCAACAKTGTPRVRVLVSGSYTILRRKAHQERNKAAVKGRRPDCTSCAVAGISTKG